MDRSRSLLDRAAIIPIAVCALLFGSTVSVTAQSADPSAAAPATISADCAKDKLALKTPGTADHQHGQPVLSTRGGPAPRRRTASGTRCTPGIHRPARATRAASRSPSRPRSASRPRRSIWIPNTVFENAFAPGEKPFDYHLAQISITPERAEAVDFSDPYLDSNQSLVALADTPITAVTTVEGLRDFKLGAATATTSLTLHRERHPASGRASPLPRTTRRWCSCSRTARSTGWWRTSGPRSTCVTSS